jgi:ParB-like chromosome segregation protein Spo0J
MKTAKAAKAAQPKDTLEGMKTAPIASLQPDPRNPRKHGDRNIVAIRESLQRFGQVLPVVVRKGVIVGGNGMVEAMQQLGWTDCRVVEVDLLSDVDARMLRIALNRSAELAEWDFEVLAEDFKALVSAGDFTLTELAGFGWDKFDVEPLLASDWAPPLPSADGLGGALPTGKRGAGERTDDDERTTRTAALEADVRAMRARVLVLVEALGQAERVLAESPDAAAAAVLPMIRAARAMAEADA